jgi:hypothetical protein
MFSAFILLMLVGNFAINRYLRTRALKKEV